MKLKAILIFWWYKIEGEFLIRVLSALNPPPSLWVSLRGPAKHYVQEQKGERAPASLYFVTNILVVILYGIHDFWIKKGIISWKESLQASLRITFYIYCYGQKGIPNLEFTVESLT